MFLPMISKQLFLCIIVAKCPQNFDTPISVRCSGLSISFPSGLGICGRLLRRLGRFRQVLRAPFPPLGLGGLPGMGSALQGALAAKSGGGVPEGERHKADGAGKVGTSIRKLNDCQKSKGNKALFFPESTRRGRQKSRCSRRRRRFSYRLLLQCSPNAIIIFS